MILKITFIILTCLWGVTYHATSHAKGTSYYYDCDDKNRRDSPQVDLYTLACNIYFEGRGEGIIGKTAVAFVTMNRVHSKKYFNRIYSVVWQNKQFSWTHDGKSDKVYDKDAWLDSIRAANYVLGIPPENWKYADITEGSLWYHSKKITPKWSKKAIPVVVIRNHVFYNDLNGK